MYLYKVISVESLAPDISQINLKPVDTFLSYQAGQYIHVLHTSGEISPLSIACAPNTENQLSFHLFHPKENHKAQDLLKTAMEEKVWRLEGPFGKCTVNCLAKDKEILFFAYGTGLAPIRAIIEQLMTLSDRPKITLIWWMPNYSSLYFAQDISEWQKAAEFTFIQQDYTQGDLKDYLVNLLNRQVYVAGPKQIAQLLYRKFVDAGLSPDSFFSDLL